MPDKDVRQGTLALMILKTLDAMGPLHAYGVARRIEQISCNSVAIRYGTIYPALLKLEQEKSVVSEWMTSENNRRVKTYRLTAAGRRKIQAQTTEWEQVTALIARFLSLSKQNV